MGADGGSYAHRSEMVKTKARVVKGDKDMQREAFKFCTLSKVSIRVHGCCKMRRRITRADQAATLDATCGGGSNRQAVQQGRCDRILHRQEQVWGWRADLWVPEGCQGESR